jgi:hypothetical protein
MTATRVLPSMSDTEAWTAAKVAEIAGVDLAAHALSHPVPQHGCQLCPPPARLWRDPASEQTWREDAVRPPVRSEVTR